MARLIGALILLISCFASAFSHVQVAETAPHEYDSKKLYGPEVFEFCGGWVEILIRMQYWHSEILVKASPSNNGNWEISNGNILIEDPTKKDEPIRFNDFESFKVKNGEINTHIWKFPKISQQTKSFNVALLPFTGCSADQKNRGVVLKEAGFE
jgi:hypothetical protein